MIGKAIFSRLSSTTAITALVDDRIFPESIFSGEAFPQSAYTITEAKPDRTFTGASGLVDSTVDIFIVAKDYAGAASLTDAVATALDNQAGTWGGIKVQGAFIKSRTDEHAPLPDSGQDEPYYVTTLTLSVWHEV